MNWPGRNLLPRCCGSCVFAIICHMATVLWVQAEMCDGSVHSLPPLPVAALPSPPAHFHYPGGIQGVMASRAADSAGRFNFLGADLPRWLLGRPRKKRKRNGNRMPEQFATAAFSRSPDVETACCSPNPLAVDWGSVQQVAWGFALAQPGFSPFESFSKYVGPKKEATPEAPLFMSWGGSYRGNRRPNM